MTDQTDMSTTITVVSRHKETGAEISSAGTAYPWAPGLAVTSFGFHSFEVTQIHSGARLCGRYERFANALLAMACWALVGRVHGIDWTQDFDSPEAAKLLMSQPFPWGDQSVTVGAWRAIQQMHSFDGPISEFPWEGEDSPWHQLEEVVAMIDKAARHMGPQE